MIRKHSISVIAAAVFAALSTAAVAQTAQQRQSTGAGQAAQTNPTQTVAPSAATGVESSAQFRGNHNTIYMDSSATTNQSTSASQNTGSTQGMTVAPSQNGAGKGESGQGEATGSRQGTVTDAGKAAAGGAAAAAGGG